MSEEIKAVHRAAVAEGCTPAHASRIAARAERIKQLEAENEILEAQRGHMLRNWEAAADRIEALEAALAFYADPQNWEPVYDRQFGRLVSPMDDGKRARAALKQD